MSYTCKCCGNTEYKKVVLKEEYYGTKEDFDYGKCTECGSFQILTVPEDLGKYYENYYSQEVKLVDPPPAAQAMMRNQMGEMGVTTEDIIMDLGGGLSQWAHNMAKSGFKNVYVVDPFLPDKTPDNGVHYVKGDIWMPEVKNKKYKFIHCWHSLEHMSDPKNILGCLYDLLEEEGKVELGMPLASGRAIDKYGYVVPELDAPRHLVVPTYTGLMKMIYSTKFLFLGQSFNSSNFSFWFAEAVNAGIAPRDIETKKVENPFTQHQYKNWLLEADEANLMSYSAQVAVYICKVNR